MITLIENNEQFNYKIYRSSTVCDRHQAMISEINMARNKFNQVFPGQDMTWSYKKYNTFSLVSGELMFYDLFEDLVSVIKEHTNNTKPLWFQSWINYHMPDQVLNWHDHQSVFHGYISLDPKSTKTVFEGYEIDNQVGNIYIGAGYRKHKVEVLEHFDTPRITIGFDVLTQPAPFNDVISLIPII